MCEHQSSSLGERKQAGYTQTTGEFTAGPSGTHSGARLSAFSLLQRVPLALNAGTHAHVGTRADRRGQIQIPCL